MRREWMMIVLASGFVLLVCASVSAQPAINAPKNTVEKPPAVGPAASMLITPKGNFNKLITDIVRDNIPHHFEKEDDWGDTKSVVSGLHVWRDGLKLKTKRKRKDVNHGTWKRYTIDLVNPNDEFQIEISNVQGIGSGQVSYDVSCVARLDAFGRVSQWQRGVQLISLSVNAQAKVQIDVHCVTNVRLDPKHLPPDIVLDPQVTSANVHIHDFRVHKISRVGGEVAEQLGRGIRKVLEDELDKARPKLVEKINRQIDKKKDDLRLSVHDLVESKFGKYTKLIPGL